MALVQSLLAGSDVGRRWSSAGPCLADHGMILASHPKLLGAYLGLAGAAIEHPIIEEVMEACNTINQCPYCVRLHGNMARLAGSTCGMTTAAEKFGKEHCRVDGRGAAEDAAFAALVKAEGGARASSIKALSTFLMWGSLTGNTTNGCKKKLVGLEPIASLSAFELFFFAYYGPLFFVVYIVSLLLSVLPSGEGGHAWFFKLMGSVLTFLSFVWILPIGLVGLILGAAVDLRGISSGGGKAE